MQKMENFLILLHSFSDSWVSPSFMFMVVDMTFSILCGVGLFFLLIPLLKNHSVSPTPGSKGSTPKVKKRQSKTRKRTAAVKGCRHCRKNVQEAQNPSQPTEIPTKHPLLDSMPHHFWNSNEKLDQLPLSELLSCLRVLEDLIQQKFSRILWGISSMLSDSMVAVAWISRKQSSVGLKTVRFTATGDPLPALPLPQGPPQLSQAQSLPHPPVTPSLAGVTEVQELDNLLSATPHLTLSSSKSRTCGRARATTETGTQAENQPWWQGLGWRETIDYNVPKCQVATSQPTDNLPGGPPPSKGIRSAAILPEPCQVPQYQEEPQNEDKGTKMRERGTPFRFLPSRKPRQLQGQFPAHSPCEYKDRPDLSQPAQPSILNCKSHKLSHTMGSVPSGLLLKKGPEKPNLCEPLKVSLSVGAKDLPCTLWDTPGKRLEPRNPAIKKCDLSYVNTTQDLSVLDPKTQMKLHSNIKQIPVKHPKPYLQTLKSRDLIPALPLPKPAFPSSPTWDSKAEYYSKAAMMLENLHHQDPGGTRVETLSVARLQSPLSIPSEVPQRAPPPADRHSPSKAYPDAQQRYLSAKTRAFCFQAKSQPIRTILGTGRGSLQPTVRPRMAKHAPCKRFENVTSRHPCWSGTVVDPQKCVPPPIAEQPSRSDVTKKAHPSWKVNRRSREIPSSQGININLRDLAYGETNRSPGRFHTPILHNSGDFALNPHMCSETDFRSSRQPEARLVDHHPDGPSLMHPAAVSMPSQQSLPIAKTSLGLGNVFTGRDQSMKPREFRGPKDNTHKAFHPDEERNSFMRAGDIGQGERLGRVSSFNPSYTQLKHTATTDSQSSLEIAAKGQPSETYIKKITQNFTQYVNISTKHKGQGDRLKSESPPPSPVQTEEAVTRERLFCTMAAEVQCLLRAVTQVLVNWLNLSAEDPSKTKGCHVDPPAPQPGGCSCSSEGRYDPKSNQPEKKSCDNTSPEGHNNPFLYWQTRDKQAQRACNQYQKQVKRGTGFDQPSTPKGNHQPWRYKGIEDKQQLGTATKPACDQDQIRTKSGTGCCQHRCPEEQDYPIKYRGIKNKHQRGVVHRACDPGQGTKKGSGYGHPTNLKENKPPFVYRGTEDKEQSGGSAQIDLSGIGQGTGALHLGSCPPGSLPKAIPSAQPLFP